MCVARFREQKSYVCVNCGAQLLLLTVHVWQAEFWRQGSTLSTLLTKEPCFYFHFSISLNTRHVQIYVHMHRVAEISIFLVNQIMQFVSAHLSKCSHKSTFYKSSRVPWQQVFVLFSHVFFNFVKFFGTAICWEYHQSDSFILVLKHRDYCKIWWSGVLSHCISSFFLVCYVSFWIKH